jgi:carboxypeptidase C (cathepsin A)
VLFLPTYTATAFYHKRLAPDLQRDLSATLNEVQAWAARDYTVALARGAALTGAERAAVADKLARYTGLSREYVDRADLRVEIQRFCKELLRDQGRTVGRLDSRFVGYDRSGVAEQPDFDPSLSAIRPPYTAGSTIWSAARWASTRMRRTIFSAAASVSGTGDRPGVGLPTRATRCAMPSRRTRTCACSWGRGYFDLATPYFATEYTLDHLGLPPSLTSRITRRYYLAGHMMYIDVDELVALRRDVAAFIAESLK